MIVKLAANAAHYWRRFDGEMAMKGFDPLELPLDRFCNVVYTWLLGERDEVETAKFDAKLWIPPKGTEIPAESPWSAENEGKAFAAFKAEATGKK